MSTSNQANLSRAEGSPEGPEGGSRRRQSFKTVVMANVTSIRQFLLVAGSGTLLFGALLWVFVRDLAGAAEIMMAIGAGILLIDAIISWRRLGRAIFGRRGRYGVNTLIIVASFVALAVVVNFFLWWLSNRPNPPGWVRIDTTATKQFLLSEQAQAVLENMDEPVRDRVLGHGETRRSGGMAGDERPAVGVQAAIAGQVRFPVGRPRVSAQRGRLLRGDGTPRHRN